MQLSYNVRLHRLAESHYTNINLIDGKKRTTRQVAVLEGHSVWLCAADPIGGDVLGVVMKRGEEKSRSLCVISGIREGSPRIAAHWQMFPNDGNNVGYIRYRKLLGNQQFPVASEVFCFSVKNAAITAGVS
jgi:hypothetical protein